MGFFYFIGSCGAENWNYTGINVGLLDMLGKGYAVEYCVSLYNKRMEEKAYRIYVTDTLKNINACLAHTFSGTVMSQRFAELLDIRREPEKTGDEIAMEIIKNAGLKVRGS